MLLAALVAAGAKVWGENGADYGRERQPAPDPALDPAREALRVKELRQAARKWLAPTAVQRLEDAIAEAESPDHLADLWSTRAPEFTQELRDLAAARHALLAAGLA